MLPGSLTDWGDLRLRGHDVRLYEDDAVLLDGLSQFVGSALGAGHGAIVIATQAHRDELVDRLAQAGVDVELATRQGRLAQLDAAKTLASFMDGNQVDRDRFRAHVGGALRRVTAAVHRPTPQIAAFGEMVALLWAEGNPRAAIALERLWNELTDVCSFHLQCAYPMRLFPRESDTALLCAVCAEHAEVTPTERFTTLNNRSDQLREVALLQQRAEALQTEVDERKALEMELVARNDELRAALSARDELLSVAGHELRAPVAGLRLTVQALRIGRQRGRSLPPERMDVVLGSIELQTEKLNRLITSLLDNARIGVYDLSVEPVATDLAALVRDVLLIRGQSQGHPLVYEGPEHLDAWVDPLQFEQVVTNLVDNAVKFSPQGGTVVVALESDPTGVVCLAVTDHGIGIAPEQRERVFQQFHQAHGEPHLAGLGLGLYVSREIVRLHAGEILVEQPDHPGTRFVVRLPAGPQTSAPSLD